MDTACTSALFLVSTISQRRVSIYQDQFPRILPGTGDLDTSPVFPSPVTKSDHQLHTPLEGLGKLPLKNDSMRYLTQGKYKQGTDE